MMANEPQRVLVVEDEPDSGMAIRALLEGRGCQVVVAANARDAFERVALEPFPSIIFLDLALPDMDGDEFLRAVRQDPRLEHIPVVVMSGWARHITPPIPIAGWLPKPFEGHQLIEILDRLSPKDAAVAPG
jgi:CheY-like chemotaxis protein